MLGYTEHSIYSCSQQQSPDEYSDPVFPSWYYGHLLVQGQEPLKGFCSQADDQPSFHQSEMKVISRLHLDIKFQSEDPNNPHRNKNWGNITQIQPPRIHHQAPTLKNMSKCWDCPTSVTYIIHCAASSLSRYLHTNTPSRHLYSKCKVHNYPASVKLHLPLELRALCRFK